MIELNKEYITSKGTIVKPIDVILEKSNGYRIFNVMFKYCNNNKSYIKELHELHIEAIIKR